MHSIGTVTAIRDNLIHQASWRQVTRQTDSFHSHPGGREAKTIWIRQWRTCGLRLFGEVVLFANCREKAESRDTAKHLDGDVRTSRCVANVLRQFFFPAIWASEADLDSY